MILTIYLYVLLSIIIIVLIRNYLVYKFRNKLLDTNYYSYMLLPGYYKMVFHYKPLKLKYWIKKMDEFKVGDFVKLSPKSGFFGENTKNDLPEIGRIKNIDNEAAFPFRVLWGKEEFGYEQNDLLLHQSKPIDAKLKQQVDNFSF